MYIMMLLQSELCELRGGNCTALVIWWIADGRRNSYRADKLGLSISHWSASSCHISDLTRKIMKAAEKSKLILANCQFLCVFKTGSSFLSTTWRRNTRKNIACQCSLNYIRLFHMNNFKCLTSQDKDPNNILVCEFSLVLRLPTGVQCSDRPGWTCLCQTSSPLVTQVTIHFRTAAESGVTITRVAVEVYFTRSSDAASDTQESLVKVSQNVAKFLPGLSRPGHAVPA